MLLHRDSIDTGLEDNSIDTIITDPPYGLSFMGHRWDYDVPGVEYWEEALRVAKPGAFLLSFGGTRTFHRLTCAIEDAGWEIRDCIVWLYGDGSIPKSYNIGKGMQKKGLGSEWDGWGTALKPSWEPIIVAMAPREGAYIDNALKWGVAGLWIDGARVPANGEKIENCSFTDGMKPWGNGAGDSFITTYHQQGRYPRNVIRDGSFDDMFPDTRPGNFPRKRNIPHGGNVYGKYGDELPPYRELDAGSAARFYYCAKVRPRDRHKGCEDLLWIKKDGKYAPATKEEWESASERATGNIHPTIKPLALVEYLVKLTRTPSGGTVLDMFCGSGTTCVAAIRQGRQFIGIDNDIVSITIAEARIEHERWQNQRLI